MQNTQSPTTNVGAGSGIINEVPTEQTYGEMLTNLETTQMFFKRHYGAGTPTDPDAVNAQACLERAIVSLRSWSPSNWTQLGSNPK